MLRDVVVTIHAAAGIAGLVVGLPVIAPPDTDNRSRPPWSGLYLGALVVLVGSLVVLVAIDWTGLAFGARAAFSGLTVLGVVMVYRLVRAGHEHRAGRSGWRRRYVRHVYFTYVSLWVGFAILPALESSRPALFVPLVVAAVLGVGSVLIHRYTRRLGLAED